MKTILFGSFGFLLLAIGITYSQTPLSISGINATVVRYIADNGTYQYNMTGGTYNDDIGYHANSYYGLENVYRSEYRFPLSQIPSNATITSAKLQYICSDFGVTNVFAVCKLTQSYSYSYLWSAIQESPLLFYNLSYNGGETPSTQGLIDAVNTARSGGYLYLGAASQAETNNQSYAKLQLTLNIIFTTPGVLITAQNNFPGGRIYVDDIVNDKPSPWSFTKNVGENVTLKAKEQSDNLGYNRIWNDNEAPNALSRWSKNDEFVTFNLQHSFQVLQNDNGAIYEAVLRRRFDITRNDQTEFDGNISAGIVAQIVEQNTGQISTLAQKTINGRTYNFAGWTDGNGDNPRTISNPTDNKTYTALYKMPQRSNAGAYTNNSQRKIVRSDDGKLHMVYESMGYVWYERSTNGGTSWQIMNGGKPIDSNPGKAPSIEVLYQPENYQSEIYIVYQTYTSSLDVVAAIKAAYFLETQLQYINTVYVDDYYYRDYASVNFNPIVAKMLAGRIMVAWEDYAIYYKIGNQISGGFTWDSTTLADNASGEKKFPTIN